MLRNQLLTIAHLFSPNKYIFSLLFRIILRLSVVLPEVEESRCHYLLNPVCASW